MGGPRPDTMDTTRFVLAARVTYSGPRASPQWWVSWVGHAVSGAGHPNYATTFITLCHKGVYEATQMMSDSADTETVEDVYATVETALAGLDPSAMHAAGAHYAEIRVQRHAIAVSTMTDAENVREYVEDTTPLRLSGCHPEGRGYVLTFTA